MKLLREDVSWLVDDETKHGDDLRWRDYVLVGQQEGSSCSVKLMFRLN
jgi:hypothetical protein